MQMGCGEMKEILQYIPSGCAMIRGGEIWEVMEANDEFFAPSGYTQSEIQDMPNDVYDIIYKEDIGILRKIADQAIYMGEISECQFRIRAKQGKIHWMAAKMRFCFYQDTKPCYLVSTWDIQEHKKIEEELCLQSERYKLLEEINNEISFEYDVKNEIFLIQRKFGDSSKTGRTERHMIHRDELKELIYAEDLEKILGVIDQASLKAEEGAVEYRMNDSKEESEGVWYRTIYKSIVGLNGEVVRMLGRMENITLQKSKQDEIVQKLKKDSLTCVLNKATARTSVEEFLCTEPEGEHAFFLIDVDNFKNINDTFGHLFGDSVLINVAEKINGLFRSSDIVGRVGGDEFIVFMKHTSQAQARVKAQSICDTVKQEYSGMEACIEISCSVGVAFYQKGGGDYINLFSQADMAMYRAKKSGKNQYCVAELLDPQWEVQERKEENRSSQYRAGREGNFDFLTKAFLLLSHAKDVNNSLNMLVERIGRQYELGAVAVLECEATPKEVYRTNSWDRSLGILSKQCFSQERPKWKKLCEKIRYQGIVCMNDCQEGADVSKEEQEIFRECGIRAMVSASFSYFDRGKGYVWFCDMEKKRKWDETEQEIFQELVRLISVFVAVRRHQEEEQSAIRKLKKRDALTGLYNEEGFKEKVCKAIENWNESMQYAVIYTDINDFSYINDNYGQEAGNGILRGFASQLIDSTDSITCRLYSDLFICFMWGKNKEAILQNVEKKNMNFTNQQKKKYAAENIKLSTGVYFMENAAEDLEIAIENANLTRKSIKENNSIFCRVYEKELRQQREQEKRIIKEFPKVMTSGRILVYIQPQFRLCDGAFIGGEALARWKKKQGGMEYPDKFIPSLEKSGDIIKLDFYVYEQVLKAMCRWKKEGRKLPLISVNFSRKHFEMGGIYEKVVNLAEVYGIDPSHIEIEITESLFTTGYEQVSVEMKKLRSKGFRVAIDDFGTGYSSLSMLMDIPVDEVKIDKSFLNRGTSWEGKTFIENMGRLIHSAQENVIVEGIETKEQCDFLKKCGFEYGQGFLFEHPIPIGVFEEKYIK